MPAPACGGQAVRSRTLAWIPCREDQRSEPAPGPLWQDLLFSFISLYNTLMKIFFITATAVIVFWMVTKFKTSYDAENDKFHGDGSFLVRSPAWRPVAMADTADLGILVMTRFI